MADNDRSNTNSGESQEVHDAYSKLGHLGGEARKEEMAKGDIFTKENPSNPSQPPAGEQQRLNNQGNQGNQGNQSNRS